MYTVTNSQFTISQMKKYKIVTMFACIIALSGCTHNPERYPELKGKSLEYKKGYAIGVQEANAEIKANKLTFYTFGLSSLEGINKDTGIPYKTIAGCMASDKIFGQTDGHNETILEYLKKYTP
jgi:hypothetical protein